MSDTFSRLKILVPLRIICIILVTLFSSGLNLISAEQLPNFLIESRVNNEVITNFDLEQRKVLLKLLNPKLKKNKSDLLKELIDERLQFQFAKDRRIILSTEEIDSALNEFIVSRSIKNDTLVQILKKNNLDLEILKSFLAGKILWKKTLLQLYSKKAKISDYEVNLPPRTKTLVINRLLKLSEIVIPFSERGKNNAILLANRLKLELNAGSDFSNAARRFSRSQSSSSGGAINAIEEKMLPKKIKALVSTLLVNQISEPIVLQNTVVLFKLNEILNQEIRSPIDYLMTFAIATEKITDEVMACSNTKKYTSSSVLLSQLDSKRAQHLRLSQYFEAIDLSPNHWIILCNRSIKGTVDQINRKKAEYFNNKMIMFSQDLMLKLYREAIIN